MPLAERGATIKGMTFVKGQLGKFLPKEAKAIVRRLTVAKAGEIRKALRAAAPKRSGTLRKAIVSKRDRGTRDSIEASIYITKGKEKKHDAYYWHMVVFGTSHSEANDFVTPIVAAAASGFRDDVKRIVNSQIIKQLEKRAKAQMVGK